MKGLPLFLALCLPGASVMAESAKYTFDDSHTEIWFTIDHLGFSTTLGRFNAFEGSMTYDENAPENSTVNVRIPVTSLDMNHEPKEEHVRQEEFLFADQFPDIRFASTEVTVGTTADRLMVMGDLSIRGVTRSVTLDVTINKIGKHPFKSDYIAGFSAVTTINRSDFGVSAYLPAVSDEVEIRISTEVVRMVE